MISKCSTPPLSHLEILEINDKSPKGQTVKKHWQERVPRPFHSEIDVPSQKTNLAKPIRKLSKRHIFGVTPWGNFGTPHFISHFFWGLGKPTENLQVNGGLKSSQNPASCQISDLCCLSWTFFNVKPSKDDLELVPSDVRNKTSDVILWMSSIWELQTQVFNFRHLFFDKLWVSAPPSQDRMVVNGGLCRDSLLNIEYSWWSLLRGHTQKYKSLWQTKHKHWHSSFCPLDIFHQN